MEGDDVQNNEGTTAVEEAERLAPEVVRSLHELALDDNAAVDHRLRAATLILQTAGHPVSA